MDFRKVCAVLANQCPATWCFCAEQRPLQSVTYRITKKEKAVIVQGWTQIAGSAVDVDNSVEVIVCNSEEKMVLQVANLAVYFNNLPAT